MPTDSYWKQAAPETWTILGQRLRPFCIGHWLLMERLGNGFVPGCGRAPDYADLITGVWVCACTFEEGLAWINSRWLGLRMKLWGWQCGRFNIMEKSSMFARYITEATEPPEVFLPDRSGKSSGIPFPQAIKVSLMSRLGCSESEALNKPLGLAVWDHVTWCAMQPDSEVEFITGAERQAMELQRKEVEAAKLKAAGLAKEGAS